MGLNEIAESVEDELPSELEEPLPLEDELPELFSIAKTRRALDFE